MRTPRRLCKGASGITPNKTSESKFPVSVEVRAEQIQQPNRLMPRVAGQIDRGKNQAILDAAGEVLFVRGLSAPLDEIAKRAGVSKQTIYNHYGSKAELVRALIALRVETITAPLETPHAEDFPEATLAAYARTILSVVTSDRGAAMIRLIIESVPSAPELARAAFSAGVGATRERLAAFLEREVRAGRLAIDDPLQAAAIFTGMALGHHQQRQLYGLPAELTPEGIDALAEECARRFMRAYAP